MESTGYCSCDFCMLNDAYEFSMLIAAVRRDGLELFDAPNTFGHGSQALSSSYCGGEQYVDAGQGHL